MNREIADTAPVLIVGGGPVGLSLAIDLGWRGVRSILVDQAPREARTKHPRMDQVSVRSMEHIRRWGMIAEVEKAGFPRHMPRDIVFATALLGYELEREPMASDAVRPPPDFSPEKHELCPQNFFDAALQRIADSFEDTDIRYGERLVSFADDGGKVFAEIERMISKDRYRIQCDYLAGCDGAGSNVASMLAIGSEGASLLAQSTNIFFSSRDLSRRIKDPGYRYILIDANEVWASVVRMDGRDLWRIQVLDRPGRVEWSDGELRAIVDKAVGDRVAYKLESIAPWLRRELIADHFSAGRCFLVGDAAHQLSPTGGYGMNTGIGDAVDLSWKLAAVLAGWGGYNLLDSYAAERRPVALRNVRRATVNFDRMRGVASDPALLDHGEEGEAVRRRLGPAIRASMSEEWESMGIHLGYSYAASPIVIPDGTREPPDDPADYRQNARPGARAPHAWIAPGLSTLDLFGRGFVLLLFGEEDGAALCKAAARRGMPLSVKRIDDPEVARLYEMPMVLVRPDGHVAWRGMRIEDPLRIIDTVRGAATNDEPGQDGSALHSATEGSAR